MPSNDNSAVTRMPENPEAVGGAPAASGMMTPQSPEGDIESAKIDAYSAVKLLDRAIARIGRQSEHASAMLRARAELTKQFGEQEEDLERFSSADLKRMLTTLAGSGDPGRPPQSQGQPQ